MIGSPSGASETSLMRMQSRRIAIIPETNEN
jgi:hypothetical protein